MSRIVLTGGGTGGHVIPNLALLKSLKDEGFSCHYIGSKNGIEKELVKDIPYFEIQSGKLRRYISLKNLTDSFRVVKGVSDAFKIMRRIKPNIVFSKGGFVSVPVILAARLLKIPVIIHESDITPGLANKISIPFARVVCVSFPETLKYVGEKGILTGSPIREKILTGDKAKLKYSLKKLPTVLIMGGSTGALSINNYVWENIESLSADYNIVHLTGKGKINREIKSDGYIQLEYADEEMPHLYDLADIVVSRAGANSLAEFLALKIPNILIPLPKSQSRGDQIENARSFKSQGFSEMLEEQNITNLKKHLDAMYKERIKYKLKMSESPLNNGVLEVMNVIKNTEKSF